MTNPTMDFGKYKIQLLPSTGEVALDNENPIKTLEGQQPVSVVESFWARKAREGRWRSAITQTGVVNANNISVLEISPSLGTRLYPRKACIGATVDCQILCKLHTKVKYASADTDGVMYQVTYAKAGTPVVFEFDGEVWIEEGGFFGVATFGVGTAGAFYASVLGLEVSVDA